MVKEVRVGQRGGERRLREQRHVLREVIDGQPAKFQLLVGWG